MAGMVMNDASLTAEDASGPAVAGSHTEARSDAGTEAPCQHGTMPAGCAAIAGCAVFAQSSVWSLERLAGPNARAVFAVATAPRSATRSPELPPPRTS